MACMSEKDLLKARKKAKVVFLRCLPHALLCIAYLLYLILGTLIFQAIEGSALATYMDDVTGMKEDLDAARLNETMSEGDWSELLDNFTDLVSRPEWKMAKLQSDQDGMAWKFSSTMLFCLITITTIGYGDIVPVTTSGRIFVGFYATFGIPLNVIFLADIGYLLAKVIIAMMQAWKSRSSKRGNRRMVANRPPLRGMRPTEKKRQVGGQNSIFASRGFSIHGPKSVVVKVDKEHPVRMQSSLRRGVITKTHGGQLGRVTQSERRTATPKETLYPHIKDTSFVEDEKAAQNNGFETVSLEAVSPNVTQSQDNLVSSEQQPNVSPIEMKSFQQKLDEESEDKNELEKVTESGEHGEATPNGMDMEMIEDRTEVPLIIVCLLMVTYVLIGAAMMSYIEPWTYGQSLYFTIITFTTIGFGDMVPDNNYRDDIFFVCIIYTVLGLSVVSTCIALTQAKILRAIDRFTNWVRSFS